MRIINQLLVKIRISLITMLVSSSLSGQSLLPDYKIQYGNTKPEDVKKVLDRVLNYLDQETPAMIINRSTGELITDLKKPNKDAILQKSNFRNTFVYPLWLLCVLREMDFAFFYLVRH